MGRAAAKNQINLALAFETEVYELFQPDNANEILTKYSSEVKAAVDSIRNTYLA